MAKNDIIKDSLDKIFDGIQQLRKSFLKKKFTIDGRLVGDIGEVIVERNYDVILYKKVAKNYDGITSDGKRVQIKATFKNSLTFSKIPDYYLGIKINKAGSYTEIYNGPGKYIVAKYGHRKGFGKILLSFPNSVLKELSKGIPESERIKRRENKKIFKYQ